MTFKSNRGTSAEFIELTGTPFFLDSSQDKYIEEISKRVIGLRKLGQLSPEVLHNIRKYFRIKNIYHSNAIEGNALSVGETREVVENGLTITGKSLKDQAEAKNLSEALDYLEGLAKDRETPLTESDIRQLHYFVLKGINDAEAGKYRSVQVEISGSDFKPPSVEQVPSQMQEFCMWLKEVTVSESKIGANEGLVNAAIAHTWFVYIHPFVDGNGRVARLLMNLLLMRYGYPIGIITKEDRLRYYDALEEAQSSDLTPFVALLVECLHESLEEYESAAHEQREREEWAASLASRFGETQIRKVKIEYDVWKNAMELLKSYFHQITESLSDNITLGKVYFKDFGTLEFEKYLSLRNGESAKKTWFFRLDFKCEDRAARYLLFFGTPTRSLRSLVDVTLHIAREEPPSSFHYERLDLVTQPNVPNLVEIGYSPAEEKYLIRCKNNATSLEKMDSFGRRFFEDIISKHFN